ncbi:MAG TPA: phosphoadenylyl-sulfate reductase [Acidothermaceae bacterium]|nr:phosphoadenylyl-sulfate reductase [Acidothermaceae bacterium]
MTAALDLERVARDAGRELENATPPEILSWAAQTFGDRFCVLSSMADAVVLSLAAAAKPGVDVVFLDTGYHFAETIGTRDAIAASYEVNVISATPAQSVAEQDAKYGKDLFARDPDQCCALRKVAPMNTALANYDAWATGLRRDESSTRADTPVVQWDARRRKVKVNPIARWTQSDVDDYIAANNILVNPLLDDGYLSIGCWPCTARVEPGADVRSGRWAGRAKTECGIHL